jgi:hypothetical protein
MTGHTVRTIYIIRSAVGKCVSGRMDGIVLGVRTMRRRTAVEKEMMRNAEECVSCCGEKGVRPNSDVQSVVIYRLP